MKRTLALLVLLCMLFAFACSKNGGKNDDDVTKAPADNAGADQSPLNPDGTAPTPDSGSKENESNVYVISDELLYEDELCAVKLVKVDPNDLWGLALKLNIKNKSADKNLTFSVENASLNGYEVRPFWFEDIAAGKESNCSITFYDSLLAQIGSSAAEEIALDLVVSDADDMYADKLVKEHCVIYPTGLAADKVVYPPRRTTDKEYVAVDNEEFTFIILDTETDPVWGYTLNCYLENKTDKALMFSWDGVSVNGVMLDPYWAAQVGPNAKCYSGIAFSTSSLEENGITEVEQINASLHLYNASDWTAEDVYFGQITYTP